MVHERHTRSSVWFLMHVGMLKRSVVSGQYISTLPVTSAAYQEYQNTSTFIWQLFLTETDTLSDNECTVGL